MALETDDLSIAKRKLIVHDALTFMSLALLTVVLFLVTLFLFRSFATHRDELATRWSDRGRASLSAGRPDQAIVSLRTALTYAPGRRAYELLLAQALGDAGHTEESYNYFLGLWETQPGDGFINLRLARLTAMKGDRLNAVKYYRASIYGTWEGDGVARRRDVRLELAHYLLSQHDNNGARTELLIAGGNNPDNPALATTLAEMLQQAGFPADALSYYRKAIAADPKNEKTLEAAGRLEFSVGDYEAAHSLLEQAVREYDPDGPNKETPPSDLTTLLSNSGRILELMPSKKLSSRERVARILYARSLAKKRFDTCNTQLAAPGSTNTSQSLNSDWTSKEATLTRAALMEDPDAQDAVVRLIFDTEIQTNAVCNSPSGDDALLLLLAKSPQASEE